MFGYCWWGKDGKHVKQGTNKEKNVRTQVNFGREQGPAPLGDSQNYL